MPIFRILVRAVDSNLFPFLLLTVIIFSYVPLGYTPAYLLVVAVCLLLIMLSRIRYRAIVQRNQPLVWMILNWRNYRINGRFPNSNSDQL